MIGEPHKLAVSENDALTLEYKLHERSTLRHVDVSYFINNPEASGLVRQDEGGLKKEFVRPLSADLGAFPHDITD